MIAQSNKLAALNTVITSSLIFISQGALRTGTSSKFKRLTRRDPWKVTEINGQIIMHTPFAYQLNAHT